MPMSGPRIARRWAASLAGLVILAGFASGGMVDHVADRDVAGPGGLPVVAAASQTVELAGDGVRLDRRVQVSASAPASVRVGQKITISGVAKVQAGKAARPRPLRLQQMVNGSWRTLVTRSSSRTGSFAMVAPAPAVAGQVSFRVSAPRSGPLQAVASGKVVVKVLAQPQPPAPTEQPGPAVPQGPADPVTTWDPVEAPATGLPAPVGSAGDWAWLFEKGGARWDPCTTIRWAYNPTGSYVGSLADMKRTFARIAGYTGLHFRYVGSTKYVHYTDAAYPVNVDFAIAWTNAGVVPRLAGGTLGFAGGSAKPAPAGRDVAYELTRGYVVLDTAHTLRSGFGRTGSTTWGQVMTHEVLHGLGLSHAARNNQLMYGSLTPTNHLFGAGDLTGMSKIGSKGGCL